MLHPSLVLFHNENESISKEQLDEIKPLLEGTTDERHFIFYLLGVLDNLPTDIFSSLIKSAIGIDGVFLDYIYKQLQRIYSWPVVESQIQHLIQFSKSLSAKFCLTLHLKANSINDYFEFEKGYLVIRAKQQFEWNEKKIHFQSNG